MPVFQISLQKQHKFLEEYIKNGFNAYQASMAIGDTPRIAQKVSYLYLKKPYVQEQLERLLRRMKDQHNVTFDWKIKKLKKVVDISIPDDALEITEMDPEAGLKAIAEMNKMQGHYQPESTISTNVHVDTDIINAEHIMEEVLERHKKDY